MPIFLTSNGHYDEEVFESFMRTVEEYAIEKKICFITTAIRDHENKRVHTEKTRLRFTKSGFSAVDFIDIEYGRTHTLLEYPIVCIFGGDTFYLLKEIKRANADEILREAKKKGCLLVGHSAGAAVLGPTIKHAFLLHPDWNQVGLEDFEAIGLIPNIILPHHNRYRGQEQRLIDLERKEQIQLTRIKDGQWLII